MSHEQGTSGAGTSKAREREQIREEAVDTREPGGTVEAPEGRTDVRARAGEWAGRGRRTISEAGERLVGLFRGGTPEGAGEGAEAGEGARRRPVLIAAIAAAAALAVGLAAAIVHRRRGA